MVIGLVVVPLTEEEDWQAPIVDLQNAVVLRVPSPTGSKADFPGGLHVPLGSAQGNHHQAVLACLVEQRGRAVHAQVADVVDRPNRYDQLARGRYFHHRRVVTGRESRPDVHRQLCYFRGTNP